MKRKLLFIVLLIMVGFFSELIAQEDILRPNGRKIIGDKPITNERSYSKRNPFILGLEGGINYNNYSSDMTYTPPMPDPASQVFGSGSGFSPYFGINAGYEFNNKFAIHARLNFDQKHVYNTKDGDIDISDEFGVFIKTGRENISDDNTMNFLHLALDLRYNFTREFFGTFSLFYQANLGNGTEVIGYKMLSDSAWYNYNGGTPTEISITDDAMVFNSRSGIELGLGYKYPLKPNMFLVPHLRFQYAVDYISPNNSDIDNRREMTLGDSFVEIKNKNLYSIQFGLALWFEL